MKKRFARDKAEQRETALARIKELFRQASIRFSQDRKLSDRYVQLARKISMKYKVKIPRELKRRFCKHCFCYLVPGRNCVVRTKEGKVVYHCGSCGKMMRVPFIKERKKAKASKKGK